jgi:hypothetical protein
MPPSVTRRSFILGLGSGVALAGLAWGVGTSDRCRTAPSDSYPVPECCRYVYYEGWMLTKADKDRLVAQGGVSPLE